MDWSPVWVTLKLALITTVLLTIIATPLAWWLATTRARIRGVIEAVVALPLVLPPTVLGFYLLIVLNPSAPIGSFWRSITGNSLTFSFSGLVVASVIYSMPFTVQPLMNAFANVPRSLLEVASTLGASPRRQFLSLVLPLTKSSYITAMVLTFAHTVGEFGVVLMIGGNIPGETQVLSIAIYEQVEALNYESAHYLAGALLLFSFAVLTGVYTLRRRTQVGLL